MKLILSAGSLYTLPMHHVFELARRTGFDGMEVIINQDFQYGRNLDLLNELKQIMPITSLHAPFIILDNWGNKVDQLRKTADLAIEADIPLVTFHPPSWAAMEWRFLRFMRSVDDFQEEIGQNLVTITIENMPHTGPLKTSTYMMNNTRNLIDFMQQHNLFLTFDTAHMGTANTNFLIDFHQFYDSGMMRHIHFSDYTNGREHLLPGHGSLPLTRFLNHLRETDYDRTITLELSPQEFPEEEELILDVLGEVHDYLCRETRKAEGREECKVIQMYQV
ncbi:MAG: sugar phosphate isomerase/epimerase [Desulfuromonas sp.]|nr:MAG: sugar phosphate isomerase/epimerase [Desulfuromonas sp.]